MSFFSCNSDSAIATCVSDPYYSNLKRKTKKRTKPIINSVRNFSYNELVSSTNAFSPDCFLGKGSHGSVYKALLDDGKLIAAVKRTKTPNPSPNSFHFSNNPAENEIEILSKLQSSRIVNLIGFCNSNSRKEKLLVVEFMPNGSLYDLLHSRSRPPGWRRRLRFALQVAKAVRFIHMAEPPVIHRDIKSSNVLIDKKFNARLGDFGLALRGHVEDVKVTCTPPAGTLGYLDPGYLNPGDVSVKSDVFSFGILLLEIITGRNAIEVNLSPPSVVDWAVPMIKHGDFNGLCDRRIRSPADPDLIRELAILAANCIRSTVRKRPDMAEVVKCLKMAKRKLHAPPVWDNWRQCTRERHVENLLPLIDWKESDGNDEVVRVSRIGSRRNRKVSSVTSVDYGSKISHRVVRSRSMGSVSEIKIGNVLNFGGNCSSLGSRRKHSGVAVRMPAIKLSKSRSVVELGVRVKIPEIEMSKLVINDDAKLEKRMLEKPLVQMYQSS